MVAPDHVAAPTPTPTLASAPLRIAILTQQISNYHVARYRAAEAQFREVIPISVRNAADFPEFLAEDGMGRRICEGEDDYRASVADGSLWGRVYAALARVCPDAVAVAGWSFPESLAAIAWARDNGKGAVMMSASQVHDGKRSSVREWIKARVVKSCGAGLVAAEGHRDYLVRLGMAPDAVFMGYDAVDNAHFRRGAEAARQDANARRAAEGLPERYLLASGRFIPKKNYPRLVAAFADALMQQDTGHDLVILGDGPERETIENVIRRRGLEGRVHCPGFRDYAALPTYYALAEGFVHVSLAEQWGLVINEAAASGLPLLVSRPCGAATTLVHPGENGWLVDPGDTSAITAALAALMRLTPTEQDEMGQASARIVSDWGPERFARGLRDAALVATHTPRGRLSMFDRALFRKLARLRIERVA